MHINDDTVRRYFAKLGLEPEIADLYLSLYSNGPQTISGLSRTSGVERTRIYRLIDQLLDNNLIEVGPVGSNTARGVIKAAPISNLRTLITEREQETRNLADELELIEKVLSRNSLSNPAVQVRFYPGAEGARQMLDNELRASDAIVCLERFTPEKTSLENVVGRPFMAHYRKSLRTQGIQRRSLSNHFPDMSMTTPGEHRTLPAEIFTLTHDRTTYADTTAYYLVNGGKNYGFEIHNKEIADSERRLFEILWEKAEATQ